MLVLLVPSCCKSFHKFQNLRSDCGGTPVAVLVTGLTCCSVLHCWDTWGAGGWRAGTEALPPYWGAERRGVATASSRSNLIATLIQVVSEEQ